MKKAPPLIPWEKDPEPASIVTVPAAAFTGCLACWAANPRTAYYHTCGKENR